MRHFWLGSILLSTALSSAAVTLGRHSGAAILGRPLDIRVQVILAPGENADELCVRPEVFFGETPVSQVSAALARSTPDARASLRIRTQQAVNEPFVTVNVQVGCGAPFARRYVLLADPLTPAQVQAESLAGTAPTRVSPARQEAFADLPVVGPAAGDVPPTVRPTQQRPRSAPRVPSVVRKPSPPVKAAPRLELEPLNITLGIDRDPVLRLSTLLLSEPSSDQEARQAAIALWKSINASPEEILNDARKLAVLEAEAIGLRETQARQEAQLARLEAQLQDGQRYRHISYLLGFLLLLSLLTVAWMRRRHPGAVVKTAWWKGQSEPQPEKRIARKRSVDVRAAGSVPKPRPPGVVMDLDLNLDADSSLDSVPVQARGSDAGKASVTTAADSRREFAPSSLPHARSVATEELFDVQQQADFFVSLGQHDQAIQILKDHLDESHEPSPLAYLDLLRIYHDLARRREYEELRADFNLVFNAGAPPFEEFSQRSKGLEAYETAFSRIQALWPQPKVLDVIERSIFRDSQTADGEVFDLEAYRELLFLHAVAKEMIHRDTASDVQDDPAANDFQHTALKPLKAVTHPALLHGGSVADRVRAGEQVTEPMPEELQPMSSNIGLDVDLDALMEASAFEASLPEVPSPVEPTANATRSLGDASGVEGNLIDFEFLDFVANDDKPGPSKS